MSYMLQFLENSQFLASYDPDFVPPYPHPNYPSGLATFTRDPDQAMKFPGVEEALTCWKAQSLTVPTRPDGLPNCPLSGLTVALVEWPD